MNAEIIIAGAGHNGLVAGAYLAKAGLKVIILEGRSVIGGGATTEELTLPGFLHDSYSTGHFGIMGNPIFSRGELPLSQYGLEYIAPDPVVALPTQNGTISIWHDQNRTAAEFAKYSQKDAKAWRKLCQDWALLAPVFGKVVGNAPAEPNQKAPGGMRGKVRSLAKLSKQVLSEMSPIQAAKMQAINKSSALGLIEARFESPEIREVLTWLVAITNQPVDKPGTGAIALALLAPLSSVSWVNSIGGGDRPAKCAGFLYS